MPLKAVSARRAPFPKSLIHGCFGSHSLLCNSLDDSI